MEETVVDSTICDILSSNKANLKIVGWYRSNAQNFSWDLSALHAQLRFVDYLLCIGYRFHVRQCRNPEEKGNIVKRKHNYKIYMWKRIIYRNSKTRMK